MGNGRTVGRLVVCIAETGAPVAEVGGDDEEVGRVGKVGCEEVAVVSFGGFAGVADQKGDEGDRGWGGLEGLVVVLEHLVDIG